MSSGRPDRQPSGRWLAGVSLLAIAGWVVPALLMLGRGFANQDEGTYVLSYRWWHDNPYFVSGSQYFYGPVFEAVGESIPFLRALRLVMVLGANALLAWTFVTWLASRRDGRLPAPRASLVLLITATGGMSYLFTPLSPGYYDLTADCCLVLVSLLLIGVAGGATVRAWVPLCVGVVAVVLVVTKWTAGPVLLLTVGAAVWVLLRERPTAALRYVALVAVGAAAAFAVCQVALFRVGHFTSVMWKVSQLTTVGSHSFSYLAKNNVTSTLTVLVGGIVLGSVLFVALALAVRLSRDGRPQTALRCLVVGAVISVVVVPFALGWHGGDVRGRVVVSVAVGGLLAALAAALVSRPRLASLPERLVAAVLLLVPFAQAAGTNVVLPYVAVECLAMLAALVLLLLGESTPVAATAVVVDLAVLVVATAMIGGSTTMMTPFHTGAFRHDTVSVPSLGVRLAPDVASQYAALGRALAPYVVKGRTPIVTVDQKAGLAYFLDGYPAGSTWTDVASPTRTAGILELACRQGNVPSPSTTVLILDRPVDRYLAHAFDVCGLGYPGRYTRLAVPGGPPTLTVYVPRS